MIAAGLTGLRFGRRSSRRPAGISRWVVWSIPRRVLLLIVLVELAAVALLASGLLQGLGPLPYGWPWILGALAAAGILGTEATLGVARVRRRSDGSPHIDLSSVWAFAAAALLPGPLACAVVAVLAVHIYARVQRHSGVPLHRIVFSAATVVLAVQAAAAAIGMVGAVDPFRSGPGLLAVLLALVAYGIVNTVLVVMVIVLSWTRGAVPTFLQVLGRSDDAALEVATLSMGAMVAGAMASFGPAYAVLVLPPLVVLHRTLLVRQLEEAASTDGKTGLLNAAAWNIRADRELRRAERTHGDATVLVLDLDHFKLVNDRYGHLIGDQVLAAVAVTIQAEVRADDLVGRFGGEEFVVLLSGSDDIDPDADGPVAVAERIRARVAALRVEVPGLSVDGLSVSIGGATFRTDGADLLGLLEVADAAMYAAKKAGRNTVRMGVSSEPDGCGQPRVPHSLR